MWIKYGLVFPMILLLFSFAMQILVLFGQYTSISISQEETFDKEVCSWFVFFKTFSPTSHQYHFPNYNKKGPHIKQIVSHATVQKGIH